jgi:riboflavin kinase/FMN adenylyltransferase
MRRGTTAAALGFFDGLHRGHRAVISKTVETAAGNRLLPAVFTFGLKTGVQILPDALKEQKLRELGAARILSPDFDEIKDLSPGAFVKDILVQRLNAAFVVCGEDFRFGKDAAGDINTLGTLCAAHNIRLSAVPDVKDENGRRVSSTYIKELIGGGDIKKANGLLCAAFQITADVEHGRQIGGKIGFPTINQRYPAGQIVPRYGVYASYAVYDGITYGGITNIGVKPTVQSDGLLSAETYLLNFSEDVYGRRLTVSLTGFIRDELKFASVGALTEQIRKDIGELGVGS